MLKTQELMTENFSGWRRSIFLQQVEAPKMQPITMPKEIAESQNSMEKVVQNIMLAYLFRVPSVSKDWTGLDIFSVLTGKCFWLCKSFSAKSTHVIEIMVKMQICSYQTHQCLIELL